MTSSTSEAATMHCEAGVWLATRERIIWIVVAMTLVLYPHIEHLPAWVPAAYSLFVLWRLGHTLRGVALPSRWLRVLLVVAIVAAAAYSYRTVLGRDAGIALLAALAGLKLMEIRVQRDAYVTIYLGLFLIITNFLYSQTIATGGYMLMVTAMFLICLRRVAVNELSPGPFGEFAFAARLLAQSLPLAAFLFILFPRLPGPLWSLPDDAHSGITGLSDTMRPGNISNLSQSDKVAFRVKFDGPVPPAQLLYWRGPVLWDTDGETWTSRRRRRPRGAPVVYGNSREIGYEVTLEPHGRRWLFPLDMPVALPRDAVLTRDLQVLARRKVINRRRDQFRSVLRYSVPELTAGERQRALALPRGRHARARQLAAELRRGSGDDRALVDEILNFFREQPFSYTLTPPLLAGDNVDEFLFNTRAGFCEHYAGSFVVLARAAGIPARVVTGYQGGEANPLADYFIVRQRDAHAWAEVWYAGTGWTRVDPTAAVAPVRISRGMDAAIPRTLGPGLLGISPSGRVQAWLTSLRNGLDMVNNSWNQWVLGYGSIRQSAFLRALGLDVRNWRQLGLAMLMSVVFGVALAAWWVWRSGRERIDAALGLYRQFLRRLGGYGVAVRADEGPAALAARVSAARPELAARVGAVTEAYIGARYADQVDSLARLRRAVRKFRPVLRWPVKE